MKPVLALSAMWDSGLMMWAVRMTVDEIVKAAESIPESYNEFSRTTFLTWVKANKDHIRAIEFGREYSPVAYIVPNDIADLAVLKKGKRKLKADEFDVVDHHGRNVLRIWWD